MNFLHTLLLILLSLHNTCGQLQVKGGIIFETTQDTTLNQDYAFFTRTLDTSSLVPLTDMLKSSMEIYNKICKKAISATINKQFDPQLDKDKLQVITFPDIPYLVKSISTLFIPPQTNIKDAEVTCAKYNATLPEIRTSDDLISMKSFCKNNGLKDVVSNIRYDSQFSRFYYESDYLSVENTPYARFAYFNDRKQLAYSPWHIDQVNQNLRTNAQHMTMFYTNCNDNLEPLLSTVPNGIQKFVCEIRHPYKPQFLLDDYQIALFTWISHNCKRDSLPLQSHIDHTIREIEQITSSSLSSNRNFIMQSLLPQITSDIDLPKINQLGNIDSFQSDQPDSSVVNSKDIQHQYFHNMSRQQLWTDIIETLQITSNNITLADVNKYLKIQNSKHIPTRHKRWLWNAAELTKLTGQRLYNFLHNIVSTFTNFQSEQPPLITVKQFQDLTFGISALKLNQQELSKLFSKVNAEIKILNKTRLEDFDVITTLMAEIDTKQSIRFAINIFRQITMKIANILIAASQGTTSPFVLNNAEFRELKSQLRSIKYNPKEITNNMDQIKTKLISNNGIDGLTLQLKIPIIDTDRQYQFFRLTPIPIFSSNEMLIPDIGTTNIAINRDFTFYTTLTQYDFWKCIDSQEHCVSNLPMRQSTSGHNCVMTSFLTDEISCPLAKISSPPIPFLFYHKLELIYSVPEPIKIFINCGKEKTENKVLSSMGRLILQPSCTIQTTGKHNSIYHTPTEINTTALTNWHTFQIAQFTFNNINTTIKKFHTKLTSDNLEMKDVYLPSAKEILRDAFHPSKSLAIAVHILAWIVSIIIIFVITCCCIKTELYRFCLTDITKCRNLRKRTIHKINKRKLQHRKQLEVRRQVRLLKKQIQQNFEPQITDPTEINKTFSQHHLIDQQLNQNFHHTPYHTMRKEPTYVSIQEMREARTSKTYPDLHSFTQFQIGKDTPSTLFEKNLLQTPSNTFLHSSNIESSDKTLPEETPHVKKRKSKNYLNPTLPNLTHAPNAPSDI